MTHTHRSLRLSLTYLIAAVLLASMFGLVIASGRDQSPALYEGQHIARGWAYLRTGRLLPMGAPPLASLMAGLGAALEPGLPDPATLSGWPSGDIFLVADNFVWHSGLNVNRMLFLARLPMMLLGLMLAALVFRWARQAYGLWSGLIALGIFAFSPAVIAFSQLATTDIAAAAFSVGALYSGRHFLRRPTIRWLVIAGLLLGLALAADFIALPLLLTLTIMAVWHALRHGRETGRTRTLLALVALILISLAVVWVATFFNLQPAQDGGYLKELGLYLTDTAAGGLRPYLLGGFSPTGWWYAYLLLLAVKLTLPTLILLAMALILATMRGIGRPEWELILPAAVHLLLVSLWLPAPEIRHLLLIFPLIAILSSRSGAAALPNFSWRRTISAGVIAAAQIPVCLAAYPYYLSYFNLAAGGPANGYRIAAGSNLDWGQNLPGLATYMQQHNIDQVYLSTYGDADPAAYGIKSIPLPSWPQTQPQVEFHPLNPPPGVYAISASDLVGLPRKPFGQDTFAYFLNRHPLAVIGHAIFVYELPAEQDQPGGWLAQCAAPGLIETADALQNLTGTPGLKLVTFDCRQSLPIPQGTGWVVLPPDVDPIVDLGLPDYTARTSTGLPRYRAWKLSQPPAEPASTIAFPKATLPLPIADHLELLGYQVSASTVQIGQTLVVREWWRVRQPPPPPVSLSARLIAIDASGAQHEILAGDGLGLRAEDWQPGMTLIQQHSFALSAEIPPGVYWIAVGLFSVDSGRRFPVSEIGDQVIDQILLQSVSVTAKSP
jgi:hypothetical protein